MMPVLAIASAVIYLCIAFFQIMLVVGKPWGEFAWGGQNKGVLPMGYRVGSAIALPVLIALAATNLVCGGFFSLPNIGVSLMTLQWIATVYAILGTVLNAISRNRPERLLWTPIAALLALLNVFILWKVYPT